MMDDIKLMSSVLYLECRGEPFEGKLAVGWTIINRLLERSWYGITIEEIIKKPYQYAWDDNEYPEFFSIASNVYNQRLGDPAHGATHFFSIFAAGDASPYWAGSMKFVIKIGGHSFYKNAAAGS